MKTTVLLAFLACISAASALQCFVCNSAADSSCADDFNEDSEAVRSAFTTECPMKTGNEVFCRKVKMWLTGETRVSRDCGYERRPNVTCYQQRADDHVVDTCQCDEDLCNAAHGGAKGNVYLLTGLATLLTVVAAGRV